MAPQNQRARMEQTEKGKTNSASFGVRALLDLQQARL